MTRELKMEKVDCSYPEGHEKFVHRSKIPGGWIVIKDDMRGFGGFFVPDPNHEWDGNSLPGSLY